MKKILTALLMTFTTTVFAATPVGATHNVNIIRVIDGDTVVIAAPFLPSPLKPELAVRIYGVDTPEKGHRAKCLAEDIKSKAASKFTKDAINASTSRQVTLYEWDKYGGRVLGDIILNGQSLRVMLIQNGYAREYFGEAKQSWCK